jgi:hypothetical protein
MYLYQEKSRPPTTVSPYEMAAFCCTLPENRRHRRGIRGSSLGEVGVASLPTVGAAMGALCFNIRVLAIARGTRDEASHVYSDAELSAWQV